MVERVSDKAEFGFLGSFSCDGSFPVYSGCLSGLVLMRDDG